MHDHHLLLGDRHDVGGEDELTKTLSEKPFRVNLLLRDDTFGRIKSS